MSGQFFDGQWFQDVSVRQVNSPEFCEGVVAGEEIRPSLVLGSGPGWGGSSEQYCKLCRCQKHHVPMRDREIWIFEWCYHEVGTSEELRLLASLFFMSFEHKAAAA